ncbi:hypothetical protein IA57_04105 [Mangrovimonas yunxiaonensis]|uniref:Uncharacterized protein n=1 Tax=Mangrovimonas yunxiaonensis TaxID=1197477 RepID=A0A084TLU8_9FLAO|nr:hypothetical protein IA57_04105 [Mangrovimonas yunxiaonensis]
MKVSLINTIKKLTVFEIFAILICCLLVFGILISNYVERFRMSADYRWIYEKGKMVSFFMIYSSPVLSFFNALFLYLRQKISLRRKIIWGLISLLPTLYFLVIFITVFLID